MNSEVIAEKENKNKKSSIRLPKELRDALKAVQHKHYQETGEEGPSYGSLLLEAWQAYNASPTTQRRQIDLPKPEPKLAAKYRLPHDLLQFILDHGTQDDIEWITGNLKNFGEAIRARPLVKKHGN